MTETNFVIMGLPASGKTTFLAALWHLVEADEVTSRLKLERYTGDLKYLNHIAQDWRNFKKVPRTSQYGGDVDVTLNLVNRETGVKGAAFFPDLAGETFDTQVESRRCKPEFVEAVGHGDGIIFFISADVKNDYLSVKELNAAIPNLGPEPQPLVVEDGIPVAVEDASFVSKAVEWSPKLVPAQVRIVQILCDLLRPPFLPHKRRLALIISAWDLTEGGSQTPESWVNTNMPLVGQFLKTNGSSFDCKVYGVSAQGVNLNDAVAVQKVAQHGVASERIRVVEKDKEGHDLTSPLVWLMSNE